MAEQAYEATADEFAAWIQSCGSCDGGLPMTCTHPPGDPRSVILTLVDRLDAVLAVCADGEWQALRWADPLPVPPWVARVRAAAGKADQ